MTAAANTSACLRSGAPVSTLSIAVECVEEPCNQSQAPAPAESPIRHFRTERLRLATPPSPTRGHAAEAKLAAAQKKARKVAVIRAAIRTPSPARSHVCGQHQVLNLTRSAPFPNKAVATHVRTLQLRCPEPVSPYHHNAAVEKTSAGALRSPIRHLRTQQLRRPLAVSPTTRRVNEPALAMRLHKITKLNAVRSAQEQDQQQQEQREQQLQQQEQQECDRGGSAAAGNKGEGVPQGVPLGSKSVRGTGSAGGAVGVFIRTLQLRHPEQLSPYFASAALLAGHAGARHFFCCPTA
jgi:hypothetical protein